MAVNLCKNCGADMPEDRKKRRCKACITEAARIYRASKTYTGKITIITCDTCGNTFERIKRRASEEDEFFYLRDDDYFDCVCGCRLWKWGLTNRGTPDSSYPIVTAGLKTRINVRRELLNLDFMNPNAKVVDVCNNPRCINLDHLEELSFWPPEDMSEYAGAVRDCVVCGKMRPVEFYYNEEVMCKACRHQKHVIRYIRKKKYGG